MRTRKATPLVIQKRINVGILKPEKVNPKDRYPTIGFDTQSNEWYAWNHQAYNAYHIGSKVPVGSCAYTKERGVWEAKTLEDAKQMAIDFARNLAPG